MDAEVIFETCLNPKTRRLIRFDVADAEKTVEMLGLLHGKTAKMSQARKDMLDNSKTNYLTLDN